MPECECPLGPQARLGTAETRSSAITKTATHAGLLIGSSWGSDASRPTNILVNGPLGARWGPAGPSGGSGIPRGAAGPALLAAQPGGGGRAAQGDAPASSPLG